MSLQLLQKTSAKNNSYRRIEEKDNQSNDDRSQGSEYSMVREQKSQPAGNKMVHQIIELD